VLLLRVLLLRVVVLLLRVVVLLLRVVVLLLRVVGIYRGDTSAGELLRVFSEVAFSEAGIKEDSNPRSTKWGHPLP
jgi:hypothetical protein